MIAFTGNIFFSTDELVTSCGAVASLKGDAPEQAVRPEDLERYERFGPDDGIVFVAPYLPELLNEEELWAIITHEQGHITLGHLETYKGVKGVVNDVEIELEADAYAISTHGAKTLRSALGKTASAICSHMAALYDIPKDAQFDIMKKVVVSLRPRLAAIRAAM